jgi:pyrroline-5-carboxylate reductase
MIESVAVIGAGAIGGAIVRCLQESGLFKEVTATRRGLEKIKSFEDIGVNLTSDNVEAAGNAEVVFLCVKPGDIGKVLKETREAISNKLVISTAAIIPLDSYREIAPESRFVRTMPNIAALVGESFTAYSCADEVTQEDRGVVNHLLGTMGKCQEVEEKYMDALTGLSGSAPAYIAIIIEALMYAGLKVGLPRELSLYSSAQAVLGAAKLVLEGEVDVSRIKEMVTTPGGTTIEGIYQLEDGKLRTALMNAVVAASEKSINIRYNWNNN